MASHQIAIAKASFSAGLLRPDPTSVHRDEIAAFHSALDKALSRCSPANIQTCKAWLLRNVVQSSNRVGVLGKYLVALSESFKPTDEKPRGLDPQGRRETSGKRKRLHILYLLNDVFHHTKYHSENKAAFSTVTGVLQPYIIDLIGQAAAFDREKNPKHHRRLDELLDIWKANGYYSAEYVDKLREAVLNSASIDAIKASVGASDGNADAGKEATSKDAPFVMPATHGDASTPYYDLPAGNLVPHIIPDSTAPIRPDAVKPLQFLAGPADQKLVTALKKFLKDVDRIYENDEPEHDENTIVDIDEMGQMVVRDEATGDIVGGETYYGWSREFCEQMKKRNGKIPRGRSESRSLSRSRSRSSSSSPRKRRRYSDSPSSDGRRRSRSRSRSSSLSYRRRPRRNHSYSRSRSPSRRRSRSPSREKSYSPRPASPPRSSFPQPHQSYPSQGIPPPPPPGQFPFTQNFVPPPGSGGYPIPPPPPPNYQGPWPPPPPPPQTGGAFPPPGIDPRTGMPIPGFPHFQQQGGQYPPPPPGQYPGFQSWGHQQPGGRGYPPQGRGGWR
ncbi:hypothetical protein Plec18167_004813 [Paecilomyces lecythidis]|uniref:CID domain-containing protein n=1 Tax=Paecilomyces lecythidis TaxID=3004212 RepID=A0ABR3XNF4_9EURO